MSGPEKKIQDDCLDWLKQQGIYHLNTHGNAFERRGRPDIIVCHCGQFIGIELKKGPGSVPDPLQQKHLREIRENGGIAEWVTSLEDLISTVRRAESI